MSTINQKQLEWMKQVADYPVKQILRIYLEQFGQDVIGDFCKNNKISLSSIPSDYKAYAAISKTASNKTGLYCNNNNTNGQGVEYFWRGAKWYVCLSLISKDVEWDDEMIRPEVKPTISNMIYSAQTILAIFQSNPEYAELLKTLKLQLDTKNVTLELLDSRFPNFTLPTRIGFIINRII